MPIVRAKDGSIDIDTLVDQRIEANRDEIRKQVIRETLSEMLKEASSKETTLEEFISQLKGTSEEIWKFANQRPLRELVEEISGVSQLIADNQRLREELRQYRGRGGRAPRSDRAAIEDIKKQILEHLQGKEPMTIGQLVKTLNTDTSTLKKPLSELRSAGRIKAEGARRSMRYSLP